METKLERGKSGKMERVERDTSVAPNNLQEYQRPHDRYWVVPMGWSPVFGWCVQDRQTCIKVKMDLRKALAYVRAMNRYHNQRSASAILNQVFDTES